MKRSKLAFIGAVSISVAFGLGSLTTVANERWDGISVCVNHETRNVTAASGNKCPGGSTLKRMGLEGADGENGLDGTQILSGQGSPAISLGVVGDFYIDLTTGTLHGPKKENGWSNALSLRGSDGASGSGSRGPAGPQGPAGATGPQGPAGPGADIRESYFITKSYVPISATATGNGPTVVFSETNFEAGFYSYVVAVDVREAQASGPTPGTLCQIQARNSDYITHYSADSPESSSHFSFTGWVEFDGDPDLDFLELICESYAYPQALPTVGDEDDEVEVTVAVMLSPIHSIDIRDLDP